MTSLYYIVTYRKNVKKIDVQCFHQYLLLQKFIEKYSHLLGLRNIVKRRICLDTCKTKREINIRSKVFFLAVKLFPKIKLVVSPFKGRGREVVGLRFLYLWSKATKIWLIYVKFDFVILYDLLKFA